MSLTLASLTDWLLPLSLAGVPAVASAGAALLAVRSARASQTAEAEAARLRSLEERTSERKYETYAPMLELLAKVLDSARTGAVPSDAEFLERISTFSTWIGVWGSDEALRAFQRFMQCLYHDPPPQIMLRQYAEFVLAARRDMGDPGSIATADDVLGLRIKDLYDSPRSAAAVSLPLTELYEREQWTPPWPSGA